MCTRYLSLGLLSLVIALAGVALADPQDSAPAPRAIPPEPAPKSVLTQSPPAAISQAGNPDSPDDMKVLASGPIHEGFAQPYDAKPQAGPIAPRKPPEPITEIPPDQKPEGQNVQWIPGYWGWDSDKNDYIWVSGVWRATPTDRRWVPGYWNQADNGWQWVSGFWAPAAQAEMQYVPQPPDSIDNGPSAPGSEEESYYVPGSWVYRSPRFAWRPGYWLGYRPGYIWNPARYYWTPNGYLFNDGYWDYSLENRGCCFAPVCFGGNWWCNAGYGFGFRPWWCWGFGNNWAFNGFWARPGWGHYYWGNYYGQRFAGLGFHPWYSWGARFHDPLFGYYRWNNRGNPNWAGGLRSDFLARSNGTLPALPRTLAEQRSFAGRAGGNQVTALRPFNQLGGNTRLSTLNAAQAAQNRTAANSIRQLGNNRQLAESRAGGARTTAFKLPTSGNVSHASSGPIIHNAGVGNTVNTNRGNTLSHATSSPGPASRPATTVRSLSAPAARSTVSPARAAPTHSVAPRTTSHAPTTFHSAGHAAPRSGSSGRSGGGHGGGGGHHK